MFQSRLEKCFHELKHLKKKALIPYITAGDPSPDLTVSLMHTLVDSGSDIIELGVPFSDPIADGPIIQRASERALNHGVNLETCLSFVNDFRARNKVTPIVLMGYMNPIEQFGWDYFADKAARVGVDGVLVVDCPPEESKIFFDKLKVMHIDCIHLVAPTTSENRLKKILEEASGYIYYVSLRGVTGSNKLNPVDVSRKINFVKKHTKLPVAVGFGISSRKSVSDIATAGADGIVIGSALIKAMEEAGLEGKSPIESVKSRLDDLSKGLSEKR